MLHTDACAHVSLLLFFALFCKKICLFLLYAYECLPACLYMYYMHAWHTQRLKEDIRSPGARVASAFEAPCGRWELSLSPLQGQKVLLTRESSLQPLHFIFFLRQGLSLNLELINSVTSWLVTARDPPDSTSLKLGF